MDSSRQFFGINHCQWPLLSPTKTCQEQVGAEQRPAISFCDRAFRRFSSLFSAQLQIVAFKKSFGVDATLEPVYHEGIMRTRCEDCQFVLVKQNDYYEILNKVKANIFFKFEFSKKWNKLSQI